jgi:hypothetical protein
MDPYGFVIPSEKHSLLFWRGRSEWIREGSSKGTYGSLDWFPGKIEYSIYNHYCL